MTIKDFQSLKEMLKTKTNVVVSEKTGWSLRTLSRIRKARSFKQYRESCNN